MDLLSQEKFLKVMSVTRFHFISGMPLSGADQLVSILAQNTDLSVERDGPAEAVMSDLMDQCSDRDRPMSRIDPEVQTAILRNTLDALHHRRAMDSVILDHNDRWLGKLPRLLKLFPLSRFVLTVRDPSAIAAEMAEIGGAVKSPSVLMAEDGVIGRPMAQVRAALQGPQADRVLLIDRDRLVADPLRVMQVLYQFLRLGMFEHDLRPLEVLASEARLMKGIERRMVVLDPKARKRGPKDGASQLPVWRRMPRTQATLLLAESG